MLDQEHPYDKHILCVGMVVLAAIMLVCVGCFRADAAPSPLRPVPVWTRADLCGDWDCVFGSWLWRIHISPDGSHEWRSAADQLDYSGKWRLEGKRLGTQQLVIAEYNLHGPMDRDFYAINLSHSPVGYEDGKQAMVGTVNWRGNHYHVKMTRSVERLLVRPKATD